MKQIRVYSSLPGERRTLPSNTDASLGAASILNSIASPCISSSTTSRLAGRTIQSIKEGPPSAADDDLDNPSVDFRGERRRNETHASTTDPEAHLLRKGQDKEARLTFLGRALTGIAMAC